MDSFKSNILPLHGVADSLIGGRPENQDDIDFLDTPLGFLCIVCDGMGGGPAGKSASYIVKYEIGKTLNECSPQMPRENAIKMAVSKAQESLEKKMAEVPESYGMGSTFVAVLINEDSAIVAHAGDSRCYQVRGKKVLFRTRDHSLVEELVKRKTLTEEEARLSPQSNVILRGLGCVKNNAPEFTELPYRKGDRFILCTDGVWGIMSHQELNKRIASNVDEKLLLNNISTEIDRIGNIQGGHHDNFTLSIVCMDCDSKLKDKWMKLRNLIVLAFLVLLIVAAAFLQIFNLFDFFGNRIIESESEGLVTSSPPPPDGRPSDGGGKNKKPVSPLDSLYLAFCLDSLNKAESKTPAEADLILEQIKKLYEKLDSLKTTKYEFKKKTKDKVLKKAQKHKENLRLSVLAGLDSIELLANKVDLTLGPETKIEEVRNIIITKHKGTYLVTLCDEKNGGFYASTEGAKTAIDSTLTKVETLTVEILKRIKGNNNELEYGNNDTSR